MKKISAKTALRKYNIYLKKGILGEASAIIKNYFTGFNRVALITNDTINGIYSESINTLCDSIGVKYDIISLGDGEEYKTLEHIEPVYSKLVNSDFHRDDIIIAFGGGVVGDTAGYIASTFHRGTRLIQMPTTIIGQVDSSIGGKVVVNFMGIKNIIGSFYQPHMIIMDPLLLESLDERQVVNGLGEIVKYGLVFDMKIIRILEKIINENEYRLSGLVKHDEFIDIIYRCAEIKVKVVEKDEFDCGYRNLLNFGHTIGHSIENASGLKGVSHGEAVAMGMMAAMEISVTMGISKESEKERIKQFFKKLGIPYKIPKINVEKIIEGLKYDKKFTSGTNKFVLLKKINRPFLYRGVSREVILKSINNCIDN
ncbi:MAG: 3-dehydroquinate synthase [Actinomycetia bacterium]|nr:3-dehydroquinate synthase [Actinomycetes bacterium]